MRTAIVHYWLLNMRGGERVVEALCRLFPEADVYTLFYDPDKVSPLLRSRVVKASFLNPLRRWYRSLLPMAPFALESFDLRDYELVISSESGPAKGVLTSSRARHVCYCHSPMRYLWDLYPEYLHDWTASRVKRGAIAALTCPLRVWDVATASRVDTFAANSRNVQKRIWKAYRRQATVVYPPVAIDSFYWRPARDYYLVVSELVAYKRVVDAVRCFSRSGRHLKVVGDGPEYRSLRSEAKGNVEFCGRTSEGELAELYARCRALVCPARETSAWSRWRLWRAARVSLGSAAAASSKRCRRARHRPRSSMANPAMCLWRQRRNGSSKRRPWYVRSPFNVGQRAIRRRDSRRRCVP